MDRGDPRHRRDRHRPDPRELTDGGARPAYILRTAFRATLAPADGATNLMSETGETIDHVIEMQIRDEETGEPISPRSTCAG